VDFDSGTHLLEAPVTARIRVYWKYIPLIFILILFFQASSFAIGGPGIFSGVEGKDSDNDGVLDTQDRFPFDSTEWFDNDKDRLGNNTDSDDDEDGMPDEWEISFGLNPFVGNAKKDRDNDGFTDLLEYQLGTDPTRMNTLPTQNSPPEQPPKGGFLSRNPPEIMSCRINQFI